MHFTDLIIKFCQSCIHFGEFIQIISTGVLHLFRDSLDLFVLLSVPNVLFLPQILVLLIQLPSMLFELFKCLLQVQVFLSEGGSMHESVD